jgi:hypothetical protein
MSIPIGTICLIVSLRAFYIYHLSRNDMLFILGMSMASISLGTFVGTVGDAHIGGNTFTTEWARSFGACSGALFILLSSFASSHEQMQRIKRWQLIAAALLIIVILLTPLYPAIRNPMISLALNSCRMIIYSCAFVRYATLYLSKETRFSLIMCLSFLIVVIGYSLNIPGILSPGFALFTIIAALVRITAYLMMLLGYSMG